MFFRYFFLLLICCASLSRAMDNKLTIGAIQKHIINEQNLYSVEVKLPSNETAYFISELITSDRKKMWLAYKEKTEYLCSQNRGAIRMLVSLWQKNQLNLEELVNKLNIFFPEDNENKKKFLELIKSTKAKPKAIAGIVSGCCGMNCEINSRINYIVKKPQKTLFPFSIEEQDKKNINEYMMAYDNIIMSVSTYSGLSEFDYIHRGIFRNPLSMLRGDYKGLALPLHAFSACIWHLEYPKVIAMSVSPDGNEVMKQLLLKEFHENERDLRSKDPVNEDLRNLRLQFNVGNEIIISVKALEMRFLQSSQN